MPLSELDIDAIKAEIEMALDETQFVDNSYREAARERMELQSWLFAIIDRMAENIAQAR